MQFDLIVVGLGAMGSATLYQAAKAGATVLGIDRYHPPHQFGSSHAETRVTRLAVGEGPEYLPFVARSHEIWRELEVETGQPLLYQSGGYIVMPSDATWTKDSHWDQFVARTDNVAQSAGIPFEVQTPTVLKERHPNILVRDKDQVGFEPTGGVILCEKAVETQLALAQNLGATVRYNEPVINVEWDADSATVITKQGHYQADKVILTAGAWLSSTLLPPKAQDLLRVTKQVVFWFEVEDPTLYSSDHFPFFIWLGDTTDDYFALFPMTPNGIPALKMLTEQFDVDTDPATVSREVSQLEIDQFYEDYVLRKMTGVTPRCLKTAVCLYTNTPDDHFILDYHPQSERVIVASPCSGHGFKHSPAIGESLAQLALTGQSKFDLSLFSLKRFESGSAF
ncbi:MAG: N-methyl-L-tryptophan oxidase [Chloroflexota bacterium]